MSQIFKFQDYMIVIADYNAPKPHKHLASHIIISLGKEMNWQIENENVKCRGICINSNILHRGTVTEEGSIVFLFTETSRYAASLNKKYLNDNSYAILDDNIVDKILKEYYEYNNNIEFPDAMILDICGLDAKDSHGYDKRIDDIIKYINDLGTIEHTIVDDLCKKLYISKSRLSHLFKEQTKMTLHSYLAFEKLRKTYGYLSKGMNITDACLLAGFNSPSHCASTCKRMFGIALRDVHKKFKEIASK